MLSKLLALILSFCIITSCGIGLLAIWFDNLIPGEYLEKSLLSLLILGFTSLIGVVVTALLED